MTTTQITPRDRYFGDRRVIAHKVDVTIRHGRDFLKALEALDSHVAVPSPGLTVSELNAIDGDDRIQMHKRYDRLRELLKEIHEAGI